MKITITQMDLAAEGFVELSRGYDSVSSLANGEDRSVHRQYKLGKARYHVTKNLNILRRELDEFQKVREALIAEMAPGGNPKAEIDNDPVQRTKFLRKIEEIKREPREVAGLLKIDLSVLNIGDDTEEDVKAGKNPIPPDVLSKLEPFINEDIPESQ